jgi:hypothetical protein
MIFVGQSGALAAAILRPDKWPFGGQNAMIMRRVLTLIRPHFPGTQIRFTIAVQVNQCNHTPAARTAAPSARTALAIWSTSTPP